MFVLKIPMCVTPLKSRDFNLKLKQGRSEWGCVWGVTPTIIVLGRHLEPQSANEASNHQMQPAHLAMGTAINVSCF